MRLDRQTLAKFLPTQEAIKAFESMLLYVAETSPQTFNEVLAIVGSNRSPNDSVLNARLEVLEQQILQRQNNSDILQRLEALEQRVLQKQNLSNIENKITNIENLPQKSINLSSIEQRITNIENFLGV